MLIQAARHGLGLALMPTFLIAEELAAKSLVPALLQPVASPHQYHLVCPSERASYAPLVAFRQWLAEEVSLV